MNTEWTPDEMFGEIRACLHAPSEANWFRLCEVMTLASDHDPTNLYERWWPYIEEQLALWPTSVIRVCPLQWWAQPDDRLHKWLTLGFIDDEVMRLFERQAPTGTHDGGYFFKYYIADALDRFPVYMCTETPDWQSLPSWMWQQKLALMDGMRTIQAHFGAFGAQNIQGDQGPFSGQDQWFVDSFKLDARQSPGWMTVYLIDQNWNVNGWPYGYWALECDRMQVLKWEMGKMVDD